VAATLGEVRAEGARSADFEMDDVCCCKRSGRRSALETNLCNASPAAGLGVRD
jgi:hypothetical protein